MVNSSPTWFQTATSASFGNGHGPWRRKKRVSMWRGERQDCPTAIPELPAPRSREAPGLGPLVAWEGNQIQRATHGLSPTPSHLQGHQTQHRKRSRNPSQELRWCLYPHQGSLNPRCFSSPAHFLNQCSLALTPSSGCSLCWEEQPVTLPATHSWLQPLPVKTSLTVQALCEGTFPLL